MVSWDKNQSDLGSVVSKYSIRLNESKILDSELDQEKQSILFAMEKSKRKKFKNRISARREFLEAKETHNETVFHLLEEIKFFEGIDLFENPLKITKEELKRIQNLLDEQKLFESKSSDQLKHEARLTDFVVNYDVICEQYQLYQLLNEVQKLNFDYYISLEKTNDILSEESRILNESLNYSVKYYSHPSGKLGIRIISDTGPLWRSEAQCLCPDIGL